MIGTYLSILRRRILLITFVVLTLAPLGFFALTAGQDSYTSVTVLQVGALSEAEGVLGTSREFEQPQQRLATELEIAQSDAVAERAAARLRAQGIDIDARALRERVEPRPRGSSSLLEISGSGGDPTDARDATTAWSAAYIDYRSESQKQELERLGDDLRDRLASAEEELARLEATRGNDSGAVARERAAATARYQTITDLLERVRLRQSVDTSGVEVLSPPTTPESSDRALAPPAAALAATIAALLVGAGAAIVMDLLRDPLRTRAEAEQTLLVPVVAELPRARRPRPAKLAAALPVAESDASVAARTLRLRLERAGGERFPSLVTVTCTKEDAADAAWAGAFLATACGRAGQRTLLVVDVDTFDALVPEQARAVLALGNGVGAWPALVRDVHVAVTLSPASDAVGVFDTPSAGATLREAARDFDVVVVVEPPLESAGSVVAADALLLVCSLGRTPVRRLSPLLVEMEGDPAFVGLVATRSASPLALRDQRAESDRERGLGEPGQAQPASAVAAAATEAARSPAPPPPAAAAPAAVTVGSPPVETVPDAHAGEFPLLDGGAGARGAGGPHGGAPTRPPGASSDPVLGRQP